MKAFLQYAAIFGGIIFGIPVLGLAMIEWIEFLGRISGRAL